MALPPVSVNPSSSIYAAPESSSGPQIAARNYYFGGNPNIAALAGGINWTWAIVAVAVAVVAVALMRRG